MEDSIDEELGVEVLRVEDARLDSTGKLVV